MRDQHIKIAGVKDRPRCLLHLLLQLRQQIEGGQRGERVQVELADLFYHWLGQRGEDGQLRDLNTLTDRKSTRLNSSHVSISYAVFCLKKKKRIRCRVRDAR